MKITDEILNKYIDNELSAAEMHELKNLLSSNPDEVEKLKALKLADNVLRQMEYEAAPQNFTEKMMERLNVSYSAQNNKNYFIRIVFALFGLGFIGITMFGISQFSDSNSKGNGSFMDTIFDKLDKIIPSLSFSFSFSSETLMLIVSILVLVTLIATYIIVNSHKVFKNNIENLSH